LEPLTESSLKENNNMKEKPFSIVAPELRAEFEEAVRRAMAGQRDPEVMRRACEHMDKVREEILKRVIDSSVAFK
jgi:hypothetical protein